MGKIFSIFLISSLALSSATFYLLVRFDEKFIVTNNLFTLAGALSSALIGGYVAYYASKIQVTANKNNELYKELKKETTALIIVIADLKNIISRLDSSTTQTKSNELSNSLEIDFLKTFKTEYLYLLDDEDAMNYCSVLNRLKLLKDNSSESPILLEKIQLLSSNANKILIALEEQLRKVQYLRDKTRPHI
jgi:hypothetical protein